ncbi:MAG: hypothetical protein ABSA40_04510 [Candidatus Dormibacteria bacterium]
MRRRRIIRRPVRLWRHRVELAAVAGLILALIAVLVTVTRPPIAVYLSGDAVHVDGFTLTHAPGNGGLTTGRLYTGAATMVLTTGPDGSVIASGVTYDKGVEVRAVCALEAPTSSEVRERCLFHTDGASFACVDVYNLTAPGAWQRRCSDGQVLSIDVPAGAELIPVPFPVGR